MYNVYIGGGQGKPNIGKKMGELNSEVGNHKGYDPPSSASYPAKCTLPCFKSWDNSNSPSNTRSRFRWGNFSGESSPMTNFWPVFLDLA